jgi:hypothetical protein
MKISTIEFIIGICFELIGFFALFVLIGITKTIFISFLFLGITLMLESDIRRLRESVSSNDKRRMKK